MPSEPKVMDGYVRVSVVGGRQGDRFQSPSAQRDAINSWATYRSVRIGEVFEDLDKSGGTLQRPGLQAILERVEAGETDGVVIAKLDRLSRNVSDGLATIERINALGGHVVSTSENIDTHTANGRLQLSILLVIAQWYREAAKEGWASTQARAFARGALPGRTPYGTRRLDDGLVELDPDQAATVARMVAERAEGRGWKAIASALTRNGAPTPNGNGEWAASTVQRIVSSEAALGVFCGPAGMRLEDAWPPMVARHVWDAAQLVHGKRTDGRQHHDRLLAGVARCANCRRVLKRTTNQAGHVSYGCVNRACPRRSSIGAAALDAHVAGLVNARLRALRFEGQAAGDDGAYDALVSARDAAVSEFECWRDDAEMRAIIGDADYRAGLAVRASVRDDANEAVANHLRSTRAGLGASVPALPDDLSVALADMPWDAQRQIADAFIHAVFVRPSLRRGPAASRDVAERTRIVWADDRNLPELPSPTSGDLSPVA